MPAHCGPRETSLGHDLGRASARAESLGMSVRVFKVRSEPNQMFPVPQPRGPGKAVLVPAVAGPHPSTPDCGALASLTRRSSSQELSYSPHLDVQRA